MVRKFIIVLLLLCMTMMAQGEATHLIVQLLAGAEQSEAISAIGYIRYNQDSLYIFSHAGAMLHKAALDDTRKVVFKDKKPVTTSIDNTESSSLRVYPNPTQDALFVENVHGEAIQIITLQGQVIESLQGQEGTTVIPVFDLQSGTYLLLINKEIFKFIKQ